MPTIPTQIKGRMLTLVAGLADFSGTVSSGKPDIFEDDAASVYLGKQETSRVSMRDSITDREQVIQVTIADTVALGEDAEEHILGLGEALEAAVEADRANMPEGVQIDLFAQETEINPSTPTIAIITQAYLATWTQQLN
jgi:hypothetical protein